MSWARTVLLASVVVTTAHAAAPDEKPPRAAVRVERETLGAITIVDPYRWMEQLDAPEFVAWSSAQDEHTRAQLAGRARAAELEQRVAELGGKRDEVAGIRKRGDRLFFLRRAADGNAFRLMARGPDGEKLIFAPEAGSSIDYYEPSPDARYVALGISASGSEESVLRVVDVASGRLGPERIERARSAMPVWRDPRSFFYTRRPPLVPGAPPATRSQQARSYLHIVGSDGKRDVAVFGFAVSPAVPVGLSDSVWVRGAAGSPFALGIVRAGAAADRTLWVAPLSAVVDGKTAWKKLAGIEDGVDDYALHGRDAWLLVHRDAPRGQLLRVSLDKPGLAREVVVAPGAAVLTEILAAADALYVRALDGGTVRVLRIPYDGAPRAWLTPPGGGNVDGTAADTSTPGFTAQVESWTEPRMPYAFTPAAGFAPLPIVAAPALTLPLEATERTVTSRDGTKVPLSIVHRRGLDLTKPHRTLLTAYGSYGTSFDAFYDGRQDAWFERDGILAVAHVRGGGEFGEGWHVAGMKANKQNGIDDLVACARSLIDKKVTTPSLLGLQGESAGAIVVASAVVQHPELFGAAVVRVGIVDPLRFEGTALGAVNAREFGSAKNPAELPALYAMSAYYHVVDGARYPAMLFTGGAHDARVPLWQPAKMVARLQAATASGKPILLRIDRETGHLYSSEAQWAREQGDVYAFLLWQLR